MVNFNFTNKTINMAAFSMQNNEREVFTDYPCMDLDRP
jgi:hypothetical protein